MRNIWTEHFNRINGIASEQTTAKLNKMLRACNQSAQEALKQDNDEQFLQILNMKVQLQTTIALLEKLDEIETAIRNQ